MTNRRPAAALVTSLAAVALVTLLVLWPTYARAGGALVYALDDTYIHLAVAKNLVATGVWGLNPGEFSGPSSSPLWVLILAATSGRGGPADAAPLLLNVAAAGLLVVSLWAVLRRAAAGRRLVLAVVGVALAACLPSLIAVGMENALHAVLALWVLWLAGTVAAREPRAFPVPDDPSGPDPLSRPDSLSQPDGPSEPRAVPEPARTTPTPGLSALDSAGPGRRTNAPAPVTSAPVASAPVTSAPDASLAPSSEPWRVAALGVLTALMVGCRFEGMFMAAAAAAVLAAHRRWAAAAVVAAAAALPVAAYAGYSVAHGGGWLPNSVLLKGRIGHHVARFAGRPWEPLARPAFKVLNVPHLYALAALALLLLAALWREASPAAARARAVLVVFLLSAAAHVQFVVTGQLFRYEAYVTVAGWVAVIAAAATATAATTARVPPRPASGHLVRLAGAAAVLLFAAKFAFGTYRTLSAPRDVGRQQIQTARLLNAALPGVPVAANDIGAVAYYGRGYVLDLWGLSDHEVCRLRLAGRYDAAAVARLCHDRGARAAVVYESWFGPPPLAVPAGWVPVERWEVDAAYILGDRVVTVFATDAAHAAELRAALDAYRPPLPAGVTRVRVEPGGR